MMETPSPFDALLVVGFGGPEREKDVLPFLERVLAGKNVPRARMLAVAEHYRRFGGKSPINDQVRDLIAALEPELRRRGVGLPVCWGNRNWHPLLAETLEEMRATGIRRVLALVLSAYSSYSGCRQYLEDIDGARREVGPKAPEVEKIRVFHNHPGFVAANAARVRQTLESVPAERRDALRVIFTAHSIPETQARGCAYEAQLRETARLVADELGLPDERCSLVFQSRSGRPADPWLEPDVGDHVEALAASGARELLVHPLGFLSDHMEVLNDLDLEAKARAARAGATLLRSPTVGTHPLFVTMLGELVQERLESWNQRDAMGRFEPAPDRCAPDCCPKTS